MKDVKLRKIWLSAGAAVCSFAVLWLATTALAQAPAAPASASQWGLPVTSTLASKISY